MLITLKSFEKIGNLTNKANIVQNTSYSNRHYLETVTGTKYTYISDYTEEDAQKAISHIEERINMFSNPKKKDYGKFYEVNSKNETTKRILNKKGTTTKKPIEIV